MSHLHIDHKHPNNFSTIFFLTCVGRTHQCRGQLQALGDDIHIAGDNMYFGATTPSIPDGYQSSAFLALQVF